MALQCSAKLHYLLSPSVGNGLKGSSTSCAIALQWKQYNASLFLSGKDSFHLSSHNLSKPPYLGCSYKKSILRAASGEEKSKTIDEKKVEHESGASSDDDDKHDDMMDEEERGEWRKKIREVMDKCPDVEEELDPEEKRKKVQKLLAEYPLVVEEEDPDWPEDADGWGFNLDQFFNKITIKNKKEDDDDENYDSSKEMVWQDDDYIRPIKDITTAEWDETVFKDISPLIVLVHNRYKRPKENEKFRDELEKAVNIIWNCRLPSPRCVAIDAVVECDLVSALQVSIFPELIFTNAGKILYREKASRTADELSKIMAFFYYGAKKPPFFSVPESSEEEIPAAPPSEQHYPQWQMAKEACGSRIPDYQLYVAVVAAVGNYGSELKNYSVLNDQISTDAVKFIRRKVQLTDGAIMNLF